MAFIDPVTGWFEISEISDKFGTRIRAKSSTVYGLLVTHQLARRNCLAQLMGHQQGTTKSH